MYHLRMWDFLCTFAQFLLDTGCSHLKTTRHEKIIRFVSRYAIGHRG